MAIRHLCRDCRSLAPAVNKSLHFHYSQGHFWYSETPPEQIFIALYRGAWYSRLVRRVAVLHIGLSLYILYSYFHFLLPCVIFLSAARAATYPGSPHPWRAATRLLLFLLRSETLLRFRLRRPVFCISSRHRTQIQST
nr:MAG TPA_asm: hypothetical protein [Caudoviricetes sp.]